MSSRDADRRAERLDSHPEGSQRNWREEGLGASSNTATRDNSGPEAEQLLEAVVERENMWQALKQVERNRGAAGVDEMTVEQMRAYLREHWPQIKEELLSGNYQPQPVLKVEIPKPGGKGMRMLGIPTVIDRLIQQALHQVLSPLFEPYFSESSYGFRPQRSAQQAVLKARQYVREGRVLELGSGTGRLERGAVTGSGVARDFAGGRRGTDRQAGSGPPGSAGGAGPGRPR